MDNARYRSGRSHDKATDAPTVVARRRRIAQSSGSALIFTTAPFASAAVKLPPFKGD